MYFRVRICDMSSYISSAVLRVGSDVRVESRGVYYLNGVAKRGLPENSRI
jgi:hypothetical protein